MFRDGAVMAPGGGPETQPEIEGYRVRSELGRGGMGVVYLAEREQGGLCALKVLGRGVGSDPRLVSRFKREAKYAASLEHPSIVDLYEAGESPDGTLFYAMQYVPGTDLDALLARRGPLPHAEALSILVKVGDALDSAHAKGLIHRDVKPANIMVSEDGDSVFLTDFGLSKNPAEDSVPLTEQGQLIGTPGYTAPEEILAQPRDHRVDVYSLGCVLFAALTGAAPFPRERDLDVLYAHISDPRPKVTDARPDLPASIDAVVAKGMAIAQEERYATCGELIAATRAALVDAPSTPPVVSRPSAPARPRGRVVLRVEVDLDEGELVVGIEDGASARVVRDGDTWRLEAP